MENPTQEAKNFFQTLSEEAKVARLEKAIRLLETVGEAHVKLLDAHHDSKVHKEIGFAYFVPTVKSCWENVGFSLFLGQSEFRHFNFFPARLLCENVFRLEYYINQNKERQNEICLWEMLRIMKRFYDESGDENFKQQYERAYQQLGKPEEKYPHISDGRAYKDPFPNMYKLIEGSKLPGANSFYTHYQFLCESHHGKLLSLHIAKNKLAQYRRNLMYTFLFCRWVLVVTDAHIQRITKLEVDKAINTANGIVFSITK